MSYDSGNENYGCGNDDYDDNAVDHSNDDDD